MGEHAAVKMVDEPVTVATMVDDLRSLGVEAGDTVLVHSSLSALGWVCGDAQAVVDALIQAITDAGTLVMPTHTTQYSDPSVWSNPPVPDDWVETIMTERPPFHPDRTPTRSMGAIAECFRAYPDTVRSRHPLYSFAAWGSDADSIVRDHQYDYSLGENSPLASVYDRDGTILMLGTGYETNTSLHLAEYRAQNPKETVRTEVPVLQDGDRFDVEFDDIVTDTSDFEAIGSDFEDEHPTSVERGTIGAAESALVDQPPLVDFAVEWFEANR